MAEILALAAKQIDTHGKININIRYFLCIRKNGYEKNGSVPPLYGIPQAGRNPESPFLEASV